MTVDDDTIFRKRLFVDRNDNSLTLFRKRITVGGRFAKPAESVKQMNTMKMFAMVLLSLPALATLTMLYYNGAVSTSDEIVEGFAVEGTKAVDEVIPRRNSTSDSDHPPSTKNVETLNNVKKDDILRMKSGDEQSNDDLLPSGFDHKSCLSRLESPSYRKKSFPPSPYLISKLRSYEARHSRCGPNTKSYNAALNNLKSKSTPKSNLSTECNYIVWTAFSGLGNRILTIASAFLYALLTDRVLLLQHGSQTEISDLFCEPFPNTTWLLPDNFPVSTNFFESLSHNSSSSFGHMLKNNKFNNLSDPTLVYVDVVHDYGDHDKMFFCDEDHKLLKNVNWLVIKSDNYFVPSLFLMDGFKDEVLRMFPAKETVFHHLGRYLFHPTNPVWGLVTRFYKAYLAGADERIGIQVRTFYNGPGPFPFVMDQIEKCIEHSTLIPDIDDDSNITMKKERKTKAVLVTSLLNFYSEKLRLKYWLNPTRSGEVIGVYQPSHEGVQLTDQSMMHNRKAWAEMYLLSLMDKLVTSAWSTFGYVGQGLGGVRALILYKSDNLTVPDPPCGPAVSVEPCFHAPPFYDCKLRRGADTGAMDVHVRHCEDVSWGLKIVDPNKL